MVAEVQAEASAADQRVSDGAIALRECLDRLEGLADALRQHGLAPRLVAPLGRVPSLHVVNPAASALAEDIFAGPCQDGQWWFWWSWAERIAPAADLSGAAARIRHVLADRSGPAGD
jgi:hypothetical protein